MTARTIMIQGTGSSVGKSILTAALCRILRQDGFRAAPFKSQNMALNSFVTSDGGEMGRAQVVQAEAAGIEPTVDMNPVLIKPEADARSQVIVLGRPWKTVSAFDYYRHTPELLPIVERSLERLRSQYDVVVIEGAGSPAEINLRGPEIVNMKIAELADAPVLLVGDIDKGGVFASLVGTVILLNPAERERIKGFVINKFRGDVSILRPGLEFLEEYTGVPVLGVVPYVHDILINEEDSIRWKEDDSPEALVDIAVIYLPHISNSTDFEPLQQEPRVRVRYIRHPRQMGRPDLIIIPGSKSTISDLEHLKTSGLARVIIHRVESGTPIIGICGGFQMLGRRIEDPLNAESAGGSAEGLGLVDMVTVFEKEKTTHRVKARVVADEGLLRGLAGQTLIGYEIHMGRTAGQGVPPAFEIIERSARGGRHPDGACERGGRIIGTYLHGLFDNEGFRRILLGNLNPEFPTGQMADPLPSKEVLYDRLADRVRRSLDIERIYRIAGLR